MRNAKVNWNFWEGGEVEPPQLYFCKLQWLQMPPRKDSASVTFQLKQKLTRHKYLGVGKAAGAQWWARAASALPRNCQTVLALSGAYLVCLWSFTSFLFLAKLEQLLRSHVAQEERRPPEKRDAGWLGRHVHSLLCIYSTSECMAFRSQRASCWPVVSGAVGGGRGGWQKNALLCLDEERRLESSPLHVEWEASLWWSIAEYSQAPPDWRSLLGWRRHFSNTLVPVPDCFVLESLFSCGLTPTANESQRVQFC